ncbi:hypothetical protein NMY22_g12563 [Coprinellus aureogranulatus]|nr:hypothetical protein NMY22_g12563 [Coprinellus aureogranulatus]
MSVESLWDDDVVEDVPKRYKTPLPDSDTEDSPRPAKRLRQTLFLPGSDHEDLRDAPSKTGRPAAQPDKDLDIDAIFGDIDDIDDNIVSKPLKAVNADELERQIQAERRAAKPPLTPHQILSSSPVKEPTKRGQDVKEDEGEKKERRKPVHLNESLLAGEKGFPQLMKSIKDFKPRGKGHEISDLNRLLGIYQFWTHGLYPKTQFRDTVARIEKLCHSKRMQAKLSVWRDEFKGVAHGDSDDDDSGNEEEDMDVEPPAESQHRQGVSSPSNNAQPSSSPPPPPTSRPPSAASAHDDIFDDDFEALLRNEHSKQPTSITSSASKSNDASSVDDEDAFWAEMDMDQGLDAHGKPPAPQALEDITMEDQDIWDIFDQVNKGSASPGARTSAGPRAIPPHSPRPPPDPQYAEPSEWDDMYV